MATNNAVEFVEFENSLTVVKAMNGVSIKALSNTLKKKNILKALSFFINRFNDNFNAKGKLDNMQIATMSGDLYDIFLYETLEDAMLMFKYARQGKIGDGKDFKLDSQTVFHKWVPQYLELKSIEREKEHNQKKGELNGLSNFEWEKEDLEKFKVDNIETLPVKLGQRMKSKINVDQKPQVVLKDRAAYLNEMYYQVRNMSDKQLKQYLVKSDVNKSDDTSKIRFDKDVYNLVEKEIDARLNQSKNKIQKTKA